MDQVNPNNLIVGLDVGSTTVKSVVVDTSTDQIIWSDYQRHDTKQPEKCLEFLKRMEAEAGIKSGETRIFITGSGGSPVGQHIGAKFVQEVNAVSLAVEHLYPECGSVVELGGQDAKIIIFKEDPETGRKKKIPSMNDKCAGGTGAVIDKINAKVRIPAEELCNMGTGRTLSHVGVFKFEESDRFYFVTDAALTIAPDYAQKIDIVQNAVDVAHRLGIEQPIVAMLCAIETVNPEMPATVDAACLAKMAERGAIKGARVEGPLALDNAVSVEAARHKGITSELAGRADILVAPNIEAANILYKALIFFAKAEEAGIVMGARAPIVLASRSDSVRNKLYSLALGSLAR